MAPDQKLDRVVVQNQIEPHSVAVVSAAFRRLFEDRGEAAGVLDALTAYLPILAIATNADGNVTMATGSGLDRAALRDNELTGRPSMAWDPSVAEFSRRLREGEAHVLEIDGTNAGQDFRFRIVGVPDGEGGAFTIGVDLSDALAAEREVDVNRALLDSVMEHSETAVVVQDPDGRVISSNAAARVDFGVDRTTTDLAAAIMTREPVRENGTGFSAAELPFEVARHNRSPQRGVVVGLRTSDGGRRWINVTASPMKLGERRAVVSTFTDVVEPERTVNALRDSDERFRLLAEEAPIAIFIVDAGGEILYVNPAAAELAGRSTQELREIGWLAAIHPDDHERLLGGPELGEFNSVEYRMARPDGTIRWARANGAAVRDDDGAVIGFVGTATDITAFREADKRLRESEARIRAIVETAAEGIVSIDAEGTIVEFNAAAERIYGYDSEDIIGRMSIMELLPPQEHERMDADRDRYFESGQSMFVGTGPVELFVRHRDGHLVPVEFAVSEFETSQGRQFTALVRDLSQSKAIELELEHLATHDPLTGLPNRALFSAQLDSALVRADRLRTSVAVLFVDIDRVKLVTEALGHRAGDELIVQAADRIFALIGATAIVGRFSNDQFVAFFEDQSDLGDAVDRAVQLIEAINEPFIVAADEAFVNASIGIAFAVNGAGDAETLISNADVAMGRAKVSSVNRYEVFDTEMREWVEAQRKTEIALRHGIERNEFELYYQPVVLLETSEVCGYEALVRWNHPNLGTLAPAAFMPLAEESGLIVPLGEQIVRDAIRQSARWQDDANGHRPNVAINLSARQLETSDLAGLVRDTLAEYGADPANVSFEITETVLLHDVDTVVHTLDELKALGVRLSLDDFGTGYSSLTYLCQLPIDVVKVDRSFVSQLGTGSRDASVVEMVVTMARTLQLDVVAEGVETEEQADVLRSWGCRYAQGYLFAKPKPVGELSS